MVLCLSPMIRRWTEAYEAKEEEKMKVTFEENYKVFYTVEEYEQAKAVIQSEKQYDDETPSGWAKYAVEEVHDKYGWCVDVLKASARTAKNRRIWDQYAWISYDNGEEHHTGMMDVWIEGIAKTTEGFLEFGAYLSDIWLAGSQPFGQHMYTRFYAPKE